MADIDPTNDPTVVRDDTPFPDPQLYFKVFDSERDEPDSKYREDVFKLYERWEKKYGRKWPENGMNTEDLVWLYNEAYKDEEDQQKQQQGTAKVKTYPREQQDYEGQVCWAMLAASSLHPVAYAGCSVRVCPGLGECTGSMHGCYHKQ
jgi:hypothetical protein